MQKSPRVSIGLPIYNSAQFLDATLQSLLAQTFGDFELIISDNASSDLTEEICRAHAKRDSRIRYERYNVNRGATWNYNNVVRLAQGEYFKWNADDDPCENRLLAECVAALDGNSETVVAFPHTPHIDIDGRPLGHEAYRIALDSPCVNVRFRNAICRSFDCRPIYGLMRSCVLKSTSLLRRFDPGDVPLLAELVLHGPMREVPITLQYRRIHPNESERCYRGRRHERAAWYDPSRTTKIQFPWWRLLAEYIRLVGTARLSVKQRLLCAIELIRWLKWGNARLLRDDVWFVCSQLLSRPRFTRSNKEDDRDYGAKVA